ncbi:endo alpha-1,4 polygalactosaminidase [Mesorhizobium sp. LHD-90]|uniref:endo alpha-1,4 polygalactosaminidase n=1 Tax=Mesorhizobium sp. LHD-90 TaxID=3071414 RepID=UPI0027E17DC2|nr:endo alpha-1,4 polygalactosaminidase [Mesorhizobium sp. LHD-90]MDQ6433404.1 endo alpha-1,4 polygalactosaminidase [Mesorhizobium sp. LHD-90]
MRVVGLLLALVSTDALAWEKFSPGESWDWQLTDPVDLERKVDVLDLHPELVQADILRALKSRGVKAICYVSVGTLEKTSPDRGRFPKEVVGKVYGDWPDERFLDIRRLDVLLPLMKARFEVCKALGFDAIEPDNIDVHENDSGFPVSAGHVEAYVLALAMAAHELDLAIGQKNLPELTEELVESLDFAVTESCFQDGWCEQMVPYVAAGKAVFDAEYLDRPLDLAAACETAKALGLSMIAKDRDLTRTLRSCPD